MTSINDLLEDLIAAAPALADVRREHLADNDELLPHVLFGEVTRWLVDRGPLPEILAVLERHFGAGDVHVRNLIGASFLENLLGDNPEERAVQLALGPRLRAQFEVMRKWAPNPEELTKRGDVFQVAFVDEFAVDEEGWVHAEGELILGDHRERFLSDLSRLTIAEYQAQWRAGIQRMVDGAHFSAFWSSFPPDADSQGFAWVLHRVRDEVYVQERLVFGQPSGGVPEWSSVSPWQGLERPREVCTADGEQVSEWRVTLAALREFVARGAT